MGLEIGPTGSSQPSPPAQIEVTSSLSFGWQAVDTLATGAIKGTYWLLTFLSRVTSSLIWLIGPKKAPLPLPRAGPDLVIPSELIALYKEDSKAVVEKFHELMSLHPKLAMKGFLNLAKNDLECEVFQAILLDMFNHSPSFLLRMFVEVFLEDAPFAEKWVLSTLRRVRGHYERTSTQSRKELIALANKVFKDFFLTDEVRDFIKKQMSEDSSINDGTVLGMEDSFCEENLNQLAECGRVFEKYKIIDVRVLNFWSSCMAFILQNNQAFSGLNLTCPEEHIEGSMTATFGDFFERLFYVQMHVNGQAVPVFNPKNLRSNRIFDEWMEILGKSLSYLQRETQGASSEKLLTNLPELDQFLQKLADILSTKGNGDSSPYELLRQLVSKIVDGYDPSAKRR